jgi:heme/copper-type cytochrome/quinol oxidase subunit 2
MIYKIIFELAALICAIWVIYDVTINNSKLSNSMTIFWTVLAIFFSIITAVVYYLIGMNKKKNQLKKKKGGKK